jgi:hypothetical protein
MKKEESLELKCANYRRGITLRQLILKTRCFSVYSLSDGVYSAIAKLGGGTWSNAVIEDLDEDLILFDSFS